MIKCVICGGILKNQRAYPKYGIGKYCGLICKYKGMSGERNVNWGKVKKNCKQYGKEYLIKKSRSDSGSSNFCSVLCNSKWRSINKRGPNCPTWKGGMVECVCIICGIKFNRKPSQIKRKGGKFCSVMCARTFYSKERNYRWNGGNTPESKKIRGTSEGFRWRKSIISRDNYRCKICGERDKKLEVHHIKSVSDIVKDVKNNYPLLSVVDIVPKTREFNDLSNGITLCIDCHNTVHKNKGELWKHGKQ